MGGVIIQQYADKSPVNANIHVDYSKKGKKRVWFKYPNKKTWHDNFMSIFALFWVAYLFSAAGLFVFILLVTLIATALTYIFYPVQAQSTAPVVLHWFEYVRALAGVSLYFLPPAIPSVWIAWKYERYMKTFPKLQFAFNRLIATVHRVRIRKLDSKVFEIPYFHNVNLTYEATRDFGEYLQKVDIIPANFKTKRINMFKMEKQTEIKRWKAVFTFSKIPKKGQLVVDFL